MSARLTTSSIRRPTLGALAAVPTFRGRPLRGGRSLRRSLAQHGLDRHHAIVDAWDFTVEEDAVTVEDEAARRQSSGQDERSGVLRRHATRDLAARRRERRPSAHPP
jgi:hypothetical protein